ncbi:hypothetical protein C8Q73DRAFT_675941 [Cubamyces lactineus]|nr:hypothetical protein C8Q73DRAFT_675941 [Cubamyces lactineus]
MLSIVKSLWVHTYLTALHACWSACTLDGERKEGRSNCETAPSTSVLAIRVRGSPARNRGGRTFRTGCMSTAPTHWAFYAA